MCRERGRIAGFEVLNAAAEPFPHALAMHEAQLLSAHPRGFHLLGALPGEIAESLACPMGRQPRGRQPLLADGDWCGDQLPRAAALGALRGWIPVLRAGPRGRDRSVGRAKQVLRQVGSLY